MHSVSPDDNVEANIAPVEEVYEIDPGAAALVLVDTWNKHPIRSHLARTAEIMRTRMAPLLPVARRTGVMVIYAPSPDVAPRYRQWQRTFGGRTGHGQAPRPDWPPPGLRERTGPYAQYRRRSDAVPPDYGGPFPDWWRWDAIAEWIAPEPDDYVVATGDELHELLAERRIAFLLYAGFATNICVLYRDYGMLGMGARGYLPILLRDCTVAIETRATLAEMTTTRVVLQEIERRYYTAESGHLIQACRASINTPSRRD